MMHEPIDSFELDEGVVLKIYPDEEPPNPRKDFDGFGTFYCWHPDYELGDEQFTRSDHDSMEEVVVTLANEGARIIYPLFLYDHSGITIRHTADIADKIPEYRRLERERARGEELSTSGKFAFDGHGWDVTHVGFAYATAEQIRENYIVKRITQDVLARARELLSAEVNEYDQYLTGDVYGYVVEDQEDNEHLDGCWGFFGFEHCKAEGMEAAKLYVESRRLVRERNDLALANWRH